MRYIEKIDLIEVIQERLLDDSIAEAPEALLDKLEEKAISHVISYLSGTYDTTKIFGNPVMKHNLLVQIIAMIIVYRSVRRNAARKVSEDYKEMLDEANRMLSNIQSKKQILDGMPLIVGSTGSTGSLLHGNSTDKNFFI